MKITIESTARIVEIETASGATLRARQWEGTTEKGTRVVCLIPLIAAPRAEDNSELERDLTEHAPSNPDLSRAFPLRVVL